MTDLARLPGPRPDKWEWQLRAACRGMDSSLFFHPFNEQMPDRQSRIDAAKAICAVCPAVDDCRTHALSVQEPYGIWGGMSENDRARRFGVPSTRYPARRSDLIRSGLIPATPAPRCRPASAVNA